MATKNLLVLTVITFLFIEVIAGKILQGRPDYKYMSGAGGYFKLHRVPNTFTAARLRCYYEGGVLASPINKAMAADMMAVMQNDRNPPSAVITGIHAKFSWDFASIEGVPLYAMDLEWAPSTPPSGSSECIRMTKIGQISGCSCNTLYPYICYIKETANTSVNICNTQDEAYQYERKTGSCYKVHTLGQTWSRAHMICHAEGGHLAIINNDVEAQVIKNLLAEYPASDIQADYSHVASIGFMQWADPGTWWTIHGEDLTKAGYSKWDENTPDSLGSQKCGGINRSGKLNDIWCYNHTFPLICELPLPARSLLKDSQLWADGGSLDLYTQIN